MMDDTDLMVEVSEQWQEILDLIECGRKINMQELKQMVRNGIPKWIRGIAWLILSKSANVLPIELHDGSRQQGMKNLLGIQLDKVNLKSIQKDVQRTIAEPE